MGAEFNMADVKIRDLDDHLVAFYRQRAAHKGVSLEEELRQTLAEERARVREQALTEIDAHLAEMERRYGVLPDSTPGIRAERDGEPDA
jgi:plasmid stability protein